MNFQQLEYIVALHEHKHFVNAAKHCNVTQPTLSMMIQKLEQELNVEIFDRSTQPIEATPIGEKIIRQAKKILSETRCITEIVHEESATLKGTIRLGVIPTLASYIIPNLLVQLSKNYPLADVQIAEMQTNTMITALRNSEIDIMIAATPLEQPDFFEIPLYYEHFVAYYSAEELLPTQALSAKNLPNANVWVLQEGHCLRTQVFNFCSSEIKYNKIFEAGSIDTLVRIVDANGGYTLIPELHIPFLATEQQQKVVPIANPPAVREISLIIRSDFIQEKKLNAIAESIKAIIPAHLLDERLKKHAIRL